MKLKTTIKQSYINNSDMQKFDKNTSLTKYLINLPVGESATIPDSIQRYNVITARVSKLKKKGYHLNVTCKGLPNETKVTKISNPQ